MTLRWSSGIALGIVAAIALGCAAGGPPGRGSSGPGPDSAATSPQPGAGRHAGTVRHLDLEGGFYGIVGDDGSHYDAHDLPAAFHKDGLRITFKMTPVPGMACIHQWGTIVHVWDVAVVDP